MSTPAASTVAPRNQWQILRPRPLGAEPGNPVSITVVMPAHNCQSELELALAALAAQSHPAELVDVIVVDDRSEPGLLLPELRPAKTELVRSDFTSSGHGSGYARDFGARQAQGDVVLFLDSDIIAAHHHLEAHARWHEITADAVVLGVRDFVDVGGITATHVYDAVDANDLDGLLEGRLREPHPWLERLLDRTDDLRNDGEDLWRAVVGASVSVRRELYDEMGGFAHFPKRGIVDTEFGYRCFTAGAVVIPERLAHSVHQGQRSFATRAAELAQQRAPLIANHIPYRGYRPAVRGRQWAVPFLHVVVPASRAEFTAAQWTVDDILANEYDDLVVSVVMDPSQPDADLYADYWEPDGRVRLVSQAPTNGFPSPATMMMPTGIRLAPQALGGLVGQLRTWEHGLVNVSVSGVDLPVELWATRALSRIQRSAADRPVRQAARELFGELWIAGSDHGISTDTGASDPPAKAGRRHTGR